MINVCVASLELLVVFSVRYVGFRKTPFLGAGSVFAFLKYDIVSDVCVHEYLQAGKSEADL